LLLGVIMSHDGIFQVGVVEEQVMIKIMTRSCDLKCAWLDTHFFSRGKWKYTQKRISSFRHLNWLQNIIFYNKCLHYIICQRLLFHIKSNQMKTVFFLQLPTIFRNASNVFIWKQFVIVFYKIGLKTFHRLILTITYFNKK